MAALYVFLKAWDLGLQFGVPDHNQFNVMVKRRQRVAAPVCHGGWKTPIWAVMLDGGSTVAACALTEVNSSDDGTDRAYQGVCGSVTNLARIKEQHGVPARGGMKCESETEKGPRASPVT